MVGISGSQSMGGAGDGGKGGGGRGGKAMLACATARTLSDIPSALARLLVITVEFNVVASAEEAVDSAPVNVNEMVAVVAVVMAVVALTVFPRALLSADVRELVREVVVLESAVRLAPPLGVTTMTNVRVYPDCSRRPLLLSSTCTAQLEAPAHTLVVTCARYVDGLVLAPFAPRSMVTLERCSMTTSAASELLPTAEISELASEAAVKPLVPAWAMATLVEARKPSGGCGGGDGG